MRNDYRILLLGCSTAMFSLILKADVVWAAGACLASDCTGYTKTSADCSGKAAIRCPFDTSKYYCQDDVACGDAYKYDCQGYGYSGGSGEPCDGKYASCICDTSNHFSWTGSECTQNCNGYNFYCDGYNEVPPYYGDSCGGLYSECDCENGTYWNGNSCSSAEVVLEVCIQMPSCGGGSDCWNHFPSVSASISQSGGYSQSVDSPYNWGERKCTDFTINALEDVTINYTGIRETQSYWVGYECIIPRVTTSGGSLECEYQNYYSKGREISATFRPDMYMAKNTVEIAYEGGGYGTWQYDNYSLTGYCSLEKKY